MSVRASSDALPGAEHRGPNDLTRWPSLLRLSLGLLGGPVIALANQQLTYVVNMWACGHGTQAAMHVVPALCLALTIVIGTIAYREWKAVGGGVEDEAGTADARTRFLAMLGITISVFAALVIIAQWSTIFIFTPCMRA